MTYVVFPAEGYGFARPENNIAFNTARRIERLCCLQGHAYVALRSIASFRSCARHVSSTSRTDLFGTDPLIAPSARCTIELSNHDIGDSPIGLRRGYLAG